MVRGDPCYRMGCRNPAVFREGEASACGKHGGETRAVWSIYRDDVDGTGKRGGGWLTDNDTLIEWVQDVDDARWFDSYEDAREWLHDSKLFDGPMPIDTMFTVVRLK